MIHNLMTVKVNDLENLVSVPTLRDSLTAFAVSATAVEVSC